MMKKFWIGILAFILLAFLAIAWLFQIFFGQCRLYYDDGYQLYIYSEYNTHSDGTGKMRIGKSLLDMDNVIKCKVGTWQTDLQIIPQNDTLFIYDTYNQVLETSFKSIPISKVKGIPVDTFVTTNNIGYVYGFSEKDSILIKKNPRVIAIDISFEPLFYDNDKHEGHLLKRIY